jgi:phosphatidylinositol kinase/protein kinase (PI-3  family)
MRVLRDNKESLMAVLEAFVYDPLINWKLQTQPSPTAIVDVALENTIQMPINSVADGLGKIIAYIINFQKIDRRNAWWQTRAN